MHWLQNLDGLAKASGWWRDILWAEGSRFMTWLVIFFLLFHGSITIYDS